MSVINSPKLEQASIYSDINSLDAIRRQGKFDEAGAIKKAAKEFEAFFMNMMLKSMRQASEVIGEDSPLFSQQEKMFTGMLDEQLSVNLSQSGHLKIADLMYSQLTRQTEKVANALPLPVHIQKVNQKAKSNNNLSEVDSQPPQVKPVSKRTIEPISEKNSELNVEPSVLPISNAQTPNEVNPVSKPFKGALFEQAKDFVQQLIPLAQKAASKLNLDPRMLVAQAALETGWGKFIMHDESGSPGFNLFGIKAGGNWQGDAIHIDTLEVENQQFKKVNAAFRKYQSFEQSFDDFVAFVKSSPRYQKAVEVAADSQQFIQELQSSGYATDPQYAQKILRIFNNQELQQIDLGPTSGR